ncbi:phenylalanine--tRNA ligase beta subunit-related protein [Pirellulales bacterium]|nr:phenylalanine--tRNA ligase beta subunit-related protein [Pirellulales bacterium]
MSDSPAALQQEINASVAEIGTKFSTPAEIRSLPEVSSFREILKRVGVNPRKFSPTVEILTRMAMKHQALPVVNSLVDAYNLVSLRTRCSMGAHDLDKIDLPIELRILEDSSLFTPLGAGSEVEIAAGEFGYVDARRRILCRLDLQQAEFSKVTSATKNALLIIEGTTSHTSAQLAESFQMSIDTISRYCGGRIGQVVYPV